MNNLKLILALYLFTQINYAQDRRVSGVVNDDIGLPFPKVKVLVEGTTNYTITDMDGNFSIKANQNDFLIFSYEGMVSKRTSALGFCQNIILKEPFAMLEEVKSNQEYVYITKAKAKHNFNFNAKNNNYIIYIFHTKKLDSLEIEFEKKYHIKYSQINNLKINYDNKQLNYLNKHNKLTFNYLNEVYNITWQSEISKDALGLKEFLK